MVNCLMVYPYNWLDHLGGKNWKPQIFPQFKSEALASEPTTSVHYIVLIMYSSADCRWFVISNAFITISIISAMYYYYYY